MKGKTVREEGREIEWENLRHGRDAKNGEKE